ncbi:MAG: hypothetical protein KBE04_08615 [Phycisphaerae bacterium]|nr:hypothetical protein [Phycisphaerae bacterium]
MSEKSKVTYRKAASDEWPICPHCKRELREIVHKERGCFTSTGAFWCPHCRSLLGISKTFNG